MNWFDQQIKKRNQLDEEALQDAIHSMASVITGEKLARALEDQSIETRNAIEEILKFYHVKNREIDASAENPKDQLDLFLRPGGFMRRTVRLEGTWYNDTFGALLGTRKDNGSLVALIPSKVFGYTFYDSTLQKRVRVNKKTASILEKEAISFYKPLPLKKIGVHDLLVYIAHTLSASDVVLITLSTIAIMAVGLFTPKINYIIYGQLISSGNRQLFFAVFTFFFCITLSETLLAGIKSMLVDRVNTRLQLQVEAAGMMRLLSLPPKFFKSYSSGDLSSRISYLVSVCNMLVQIVLNTGLSAVFSLAYLSSMMIYGPQMVVPALLVILCTFGFSLLLTFSQMSLSKKAMERGAKEQGITYSLLSGMEKIKLAGAEKRAFAKWANTYTKAAKLLYDPPAFMKLSTVISSSISLIGTIVIYYFAITSKVSVQDYFAFETAYACVMSAFSALVSIISQGTQLKPMLSMLEPILSAVPETNENKKQVTKLKGNIELNSVSFAYEESMPFVIDNLSLKIKEGEYVAVVGKSGCGKSTLVRLLLGFEKPQKGAIYYDGKDLSTLDLKSLRQHIGTVMQDGKLFPGDLFSNITLSAPQATMEEAWTAAEMADVAEDIRKMPKGMRTCINQGGGGISGGQKQRLLIARALVLKPGILIFDEATSALDNITQKKVAQSLEKLSCTRIVIAHRLSTIQACDRILVLDGGKIIEEGTYDSLIRNHGYFAQLVERQRLDMEE